MTHCVPNEHAEVADRRLTSDTGAPGIQLPGAPADDAGVGTSVPDRFCDPLSAVLTDGSARARTRLRLAAAVLLGTGALTLPIVLAAPDPDPSDHRALTLCAFALAAIAAVLGAWRTPPDAVLHAVCPIGTVCASAGLAVAEPIGLIPVYYLWPLLVAAYFLDRREVVANLVFALVACGVTLTLWVDPVLRVANFMAVASILALSTLVIVVLREQVLALVVRLRTLASHDSLTGALNRGAFEQRLDAELARTQRTDSPLALVVFDVDHFKAINDSFGHAAGDAALRAIGDEVATSDAPLRRLRPPRRRGVRPRAPGHRHGRRRRGRRQAAPPAGQGRRRAGAHRLVRRRAVRRARAAPRRCSTRPTARCTPPSTPGRDRVVRSDQVEPRVAAPWARPAF